MLAGELYGLLKDLAVFEQVQIDREVHTLVWPNGADFDPETLHDWPRYARASHDALASGSPKLHEGLVTQDGFFTNL